MSLNIYKYHTNPEKLKGYGTEENKIFNDISDIVDQMMHRFTRHDLTFDYIINSNPKLKNKIMKIISSSADFSYFYAFTTLLSRFHLGEKAIATSPQRSFEYAKNVIEGRFELGEKVISDDAHWSYYYARDVIGGKFELGEKAIMSDEYYNEEYTSFIFAVKGFDALSSKKELTYES